MLEQIYNIPWQMWILGALSLSIGWGIRGNFGHEVGAALPGALAAIAICLASGRLDWLPRVHFFAMFGAIGWSFGGSMSYMQVVSYTHSGHSPTILYGYVNLFAIGFLWAAPGGLAIALPTILDNYRLGLFFLPFLSVFTGWALQLFLVDLITRYNYDYQSSQRHESPLYWYDTDWLDVTVAMGSTLTVVAIRGGFDFATSLILHLSIGWWFAFLVLVNLLKLRMTPPRGDNWSGCVGIVLGAVVFCLRHDLHQLLLVILVTGFLGGLAFSLGQMSKLFWIRTGWQTNWHSVMEQTQGFLFGLALVAGVGMLRLTQPPVSTASDLPQWAHIFAVIFVLVVLTYLNHRKAVSTWIHQVSSLPKRFYGLPTVGLFLPSRGLVGWFELIYLSIGGAILYLLIIHFEHPIPLFPESWLGRGQLLYLVFTWWIIVFNFERALTGFSPGRLVTEGVVTFNGVLVTILVLSVPAEFSVSPFIAFGEQQWLSRVLLAGFAVLISSSFLFWLLTQMLYGRQPVGHSGLHIRFGPNRTATTDKPKSGQAHP